MNEHQTGLRHHPRIAATIVATAVLALAATGCSRTDLGSTAQSTAPAPSTTQPLSPSVAATQAPTKAATPTASEAAKAAQAKAKTALEAAAKTASSAATTVSRDVAAATSTPEGDPTS